MPETTQTSEVTAVVVDDKSRAAELQEQLDEITVEYMEAQIEDLRWQIRLMRIERLKRLGRLSV